MNRTCRKKKTAIRQKIFNGDTLYNIKRKKYKTVYAELPFAKVTLDRQVFCGICYMID
jgi:hypothetical protein